MKKFLSILLAVVMLLSVAPTVGLVSLKADAVTYQTGDIIEFGGYPQTRVTGPGLISSLNGVTKNWHSYGYYNGTGTFGDGKMKPGDYMQYADFVYDNVKYRAVKFSYNRPDWTHNQAKAKDTSTEQYKNGYTEMNYTYYFKWEPLRWRVLDPSAGLVLCESIIDSQPFNDILYQSGSEYYRNNYIGTKANNYKYSTLRYFLTYKFYNLAFSGEEAELLRETTCNNNSVNGTNYNSEETKDKVFLLSYAQAKTSAYGFNTSAYNADAAKKADGTDYAKCQGLYEYNGSSLWWLRTPSSTWSGRAAFISLDGSINDGSSDAGAYTDTCYYGVRPAIVFKNGISESQNAFGCGSYSVGDVIEFGGYPQTRVTDSATINALNGLVSSKGWISYNYYSGTGELGTMKAGNYMRYQDINYNGSKYRAVTFDSYRPRMTLSEATESSSEQDDNGYYSTYTYYFKWETLKWRVEDPARGFVVAASVIDAQPFNNVIYKDKINYDYFTDPDFSVRGNDYSKSTIRDWLNTGFFNTAFSSAEMAAVSETRNENIFGWWDDFVKYDNTSVDKVFLPGYTDLDKIEHFYDSTKELCAKGTDYSFCQGLSKYEKGAIWMLRSPSFREGEVPTVTASGYWDEDMGDDLQTLLGVRPAFIFKGGITESVNAKGHEHTWNKGKVKSAATCTKTGKKLFTCTGCGATKTETIPMIDHTYTNVVTPATTTKNGAITPTCSCGATKAATAIAKASGIALSKAKFTYNGKAQRPSVDVKDSKGKYINEKYYTISWSNENSKNVGTYTVTVKLKGNYSGSQKLTYTIVPAKVTGLKASSVKTTSLKLSWTKVTGAKYYQVQQSTDGKNWTWVSKGTDKVSVSVSKLKAGTKYQFRVRALDSTKKLIGGWSAVLKTGSQTAAPKISKLTTKSKQITVTWGKVTGAKSYTVYTSTDGKTYKAAKSGVTKTTCTITGLKGGKRIYVKVLAVNAYKVKSAYSAAKYITVKK